MLVCYGTAIEPCKSPWISLPALITTLIWLREEVTIKISKSDFHKSTKTPPRLIFDTTCFCPRSKFCKSNLSLTSSSHVSVINMTTGSCAQTKSPNSWIVCGFLSPRQFQTKKLIVFGRAIAQPLPIYHCYPYPREKPDSIYLVTLLDHSKY